MPRSAVQRGVASLALAFAVAGTRTGSAAESLDEVLARVAPDLRKWAVVCLVTEKDGALAFAWHGYRDSADKTDFWPASCIKLYAAERGCTVIDARTGNVTSPRELAECLRRILFHERLAENERYHLTAPQLQALRAGGEGWCGLETRGADSGPAAWKGGVEGVFPKARFLHKSGVISNCGLDVAFVDDLAQSGKRFLLVPVVNAGYATKPVGGEALIAEMSRAIARWVQAQP
jgi:hypothetical protein